MPSQLSKDAALTQYVYQHFPSASKIFRRTNESPLLQGIQVHALANIEAKKKYEFLESISAVMDANLRYFKQAWFLSMCPVFLVFWGGL